jgi:hypothetical protein
MSCEKRLREARKIAEREMERRGLDLAVAVRRGAHPRLELSAPGGSWSRFVILAGTPSCHRWPFHLRRNLRRVLADLAAAAANDRGAPGC